MNKDSKHSRIYHSKSTDTLADSMPKRAEKSTKINEKKSAKSTTQNSIENPPKINKTSAKNPLKMNEKNTKNPTPNNPPQTPKKRIIEVSHLSKIFGDFTAVNDISFEVYEGEIFGFLGANGAGKSTAMKILCALSLPSSGKVRVCGYDVKTEGEKIKQHIGYMSQKFALYDDLKVWENLYLFGRIYGMSRREIAARSEELLERLNFSDKKEAFVSQLPLGWKQKLAFCVANFHRPKIIFLDEPTGGVSPITRRQFWELIHNAASSGTCIFVTTHYMDEAEYCDRVSIMVDGKISALDSPSALKRQFNAEDMNEVFLNLAKRAKRGA